MWSFKHFAYSPPAISDEQEPFIANPRNMKSTTLLPIFLLLLSTFIVSHLPSATAAFVRDTDGEPLSNGGSYHIVPAFRGMGGGLDLAATGNETCPLTVVQTPFDIDNGRPVIISSLAYIAIIPTGLPLFLSFDHVPICAAMPSTWDVVEGLPDGPSALKITGYDNTVRGSFAIERFSLLSYKLTFCPSYSDGCSDVGVRIDENGKRRLALVESNDRPLSVRFKKADVSSGWIEA